MRAYDIRAPSTETRAARLSGGNQQKIVVARELDRKPAALIAHQPAWGLDPGATRFVIEQTLALRNAGAAILYVSSELEEVLDVSDRVAVMADGQVRGDHAARRSRSRADRPLDVRSGRMTEAAPPNLRASAPRAASLRFVAAEGIGLRIVVAVVLSLVCVGGAGRALGTQSALPLSRRLRWAPLARPHQLGVALNRATPYLLAGTGVAFCFRAGIINIGAEGQIALGGLGAAAVALHWPDFASWAVAPASLIGAAALGALWSAIATAIHLGRRVHEVLVTLLLNFVGALLVQQALAGPLGQAGAGFLQSPIMPPSAWLWKLPGLDAHIGFILALVAAAALSVTLWLTPFGFAIRVAGRSRRAAAYAGFSIGRLTWAAMLLSGALAGLAGGVEVLGIHHRLIEGFSLGFGFKAVTVALLGAVEPLAVAPAALFVGLLEAGSLSMQRQIGVPSALVVVIEGLTMLFILAATVRRA